MEIKKYMLWGYEDIFKRISKKVIISKFAAAELWGFSDTINSKWEVFVEKGYNNKNLRDHFVVTQLIPSKMNYEIVEVISNDVKFYITSPERTIVDLIKDAKGTYNDILISTIKEAFNGKYLDKLKLLNYAKEQKVSDIVNFAISFL